MKSVGKFEPGSLCKRKDNCQTFVEKAYAVYLCIIIGKKSGSYYFLYHPATGDIFKASSVWLKTQFEEVI